MSGILLRGGSEINRRTVFCSCHLGCHSVTERTVDFGWVILGFMFFVSAVIQFQLFCSDVFLMLTNKCSSGVVVFLILNFLCA